MGVLLGGPLAAVHRTWASLSPFCAAQRLKGAPCDLDHVSGAPWAMDWPGLGTEREQGMAKDKREAGYLHEQFPNAHLSQALGP